jgi:hypothetical protein
MDIGTRLEGVQVARLAKLERGTAWVDFPGSGDEARPAKVATDLRVSDVGSDVVTAFEEGDPARPIILGVLRAPAKEGVDAKVDGETVVVTGKREVVLRCGKASITLTKAGKVIIEGTYVSTKSAGVNRIKGGSVQIN